MINMKKLNYHVGDDHGVEDLVVLVSTMVVVINLKVVIKAEEEIKVKIVNELIDQLVKVNC